MDLSELWVVGPFFDGRGTIDSVHADAGGSGVVATQRLTGTTRRLSPLPHHSLFPSLNELDLRHPDHGRSRRDSRGAVSPGRAVVHSNY